MRWSRPTRREARSPSWCDNRRSSAGHRQSRTPRLRCTEDRARHRRAVTNALRRAVSPRRDRGFDKGSGVDRVRSCGLAVRRSPFKDKAPVAITALDEADVLVDAEIDARMTEVGRDFARTVAGDLEGLDANDLWRRNLGWHERQLGARGGAHKLVGWIWRSYAARRHGRARNPH